jgi:hypothetical protein
VIAYSIDPDKEEGKTAGHGSSASRDDAGRNCLNLKGVIAIKLVAAPRYHTDRLFCERKVPGVAVLQPHKLIEQR